MAFLPTLVTLLFLYGVTAQNGCSSPVSLSGPSGAIVSENPYSNSQKCRWTITVAAGKAVELSFAGRFDLEYSAACQYDRLVIYDSESVAQVSRNGVCSSQSLALPGVRGPFCGSSNPELLISSSNKIIVEFCSDSSSTGAGFEISYQETNPPPPLPTGSVCHETVVVDGNHTVTYYSNTELPSFLNCNYTYRSKNGKPLKVSAVRFSLEGIIGCRYDSLKIYDGPNARSKLLGTFCGVNGPKNVRTSQSSLFLTLTSDQYTNGKGISLIIEESCVGTHLCSLRNATGQDVCYSETQTCDGVAQCSDRQDESSCTGECGSYADWVAGKPFPGAAAITNIDGQIHCGGALINNQYVLTTAHCFHRLDKQPNRFVVKLGAARLADAYVSQIANVTVHPQFNPLTLENNLALIRLTDPVPVQKTISPFCLPSAADMTKVPTGTACYTLGWGRTSASNIRSYATTVKQFTATVQSNSKCKYTGSPVVVDNNSVCATTSGLLCFGDNGAPLVCQAKNGMWHVAGINSVAFSCTGTSTLPSAFVKVSAYSSWITSTAFSD